MFEKLFRAAPPQDAEQTAAELVSLQLLPEGLMRVKFRDLCKKYGRTFVQTFYADLALRANGEAIELTVWDWASDFGSMQGKNDRILRAAESLPMNTPAGVCDVIRICCIKYLCAREERADRAEAKLREVKEI